MSTREFAREFTGYAITAGVVVKVENLRVATREHLADGVAAVVSGDGCRVTMRTQGRSEVLELPAGSVLLFSRDEDYALRPSGDHDSRPSSVASRSRPELGAPAGRPQGKSEGTLLLEETLLALGFIEAGSFSEARQKIDALTALFPGNELARQFQELLRERLPPKSRRLKAAAEAATFRNPDAAGEAFTEGRRYLKMSRNLKALRAFERAHTLDPENTEARNGLVFALKQVGLELYSKGEWNEAIVHWKRALEIRPNDVETLRFLGRAASIEKNKT